MAERSLLCVNCGAAPPPHRRTWGRCTTCVERNLPSTYYCGQECMNAHWPKHQQYHKDQKERAQKIREGAILECDRSIAETVARRAEETGGEYDKRLADGLALMSEGDYHAAAKAFRKMIKQWPEKPTPCHNLALVMHRAGRHIEAAPMFLKAMELYRDDTRAWADSTASAFDMLRHPACDEVPKPEWWNDEGLKALSARVVALAPEERHLCGMRARVLTGDALYNALGKADWNAGPRTAAEIKEAASWFRRAAETTLVLSGKLLYEQLAQKCDEFADPLLAKEEAEAEEARAAAEAEAEEARAAAEAEAAEALKLAEAKASAAAEELLAEDEEEKKQAAASTKAGKAKPDKGKRGKGKR